MKNLKRNLLCIIFFLIIVFIDNKVNATNITISPANPKVGDTVTEGQVIGIVEAMKLMNEIEATSSGIVEEILVENGELVEWNQPLVRLR